MVERRGLDALTWATLTLAALACWSATLLAAGPSQPAGTIRDPAVVPAGGCRGCRDGACGGCRRHHHGCQPGGCHPHCPVRPQEFGYHGTQWRRWPGQGVVPVTNIEARTPAVPPRSAIPGPAEESRRLRPDELPAPEPEAESARSEAGDRTPDREPADASRDRDRRSEPAPSRERPATKPVPRTIAPEQTVPAEPLPETPAEPPAEKPAAPGKQPAADDLFDESATGPVPRRFPVRRTGLGEAAGLGAAGGQRSPVRPAVLTYPASVESLPRSSDRDPLRPPRVAFDPAAEAARLRPVSR